ncbi:MarR family winged helix-turn-helix transcriptional regulator [Brevibacterium atlanticum]|uniref:MarR family winged helix-turn-helix transcriptional regulator n=1 Tax=Brevibacterium atlanticum TaxID=2697563 RepID=UPI0014234A39|nr:MarR family transcriptional regulator [Brevibacterium atlanticum]
MEVTDSVWSIVRDLHRVALLQRRAGAESALGTVALGVLNLAAQAPVTPSEAARELHVPPQSITRAVGDLLDRRLVTRLGRPGDGRSYSIELTADGRAARTQFRAELTADFARHLSDWTEDEITGFAHQLGRLTTSLAEDPAVESTPSRDARAAADDEPSRSASRPNPWNIR